MAMAHSPNAGPYSQHDPGTTARFAGLIWLIYGAAILGVLPVASDGRPAALVAGAVVGAAAIAAGARLVRGWTPSYAFLLGLSYAAVLGLALLQLLFGPARGELLVELYIGIALGTASVHPPRQTAGVMLAIAGASVVHASRGAWTSIAVTDLAVHAVIWLVVAMIASTLVGQLRQQRAAARAEEAKAQLLASTDALTGLGNRRQLLTDLDAALDAGTSTVLAVLDLDGFKAYNDSFGHPAGDALLHQLGGNLARVLDGRATAYRMGGDEFCVLASPGADHDAVVRDSARALSEHGDAFTIGASFGSIVLPDDANNSADVLRIADRRMYAQKASGRTSAGRQSTDVLLRVLRERSPELSDHVEDVTRLCNDVAGHLDFASDELASLLQAAALHDIGKTAIPDAIINKPGPLDEGEWDFIRQHTVMGERIMCAAPSLIRAAQLVRSSHESMDGSGYPDGLSGDAIPLGSRVIAVCDAFDAMTSDRPYRTAMTTDAAIVELRLCAGTQFDGAVVEVLSASLAESERALTPVAVGAL
ncbi:MAG: hypothetical protein QOG68_987 [Solirubrobacteraceae bacterium]|nr:hypothetical protein [Solirubrobacteraceae bacterium]